MDVVEDKNENKTAMNIGALLVEARENKNLTSQDIADQMNLTLTVITDIESNQFEQGIPLAFVRGYLRSYAQKVGVDIESICAEFDKQTGGNSEPIQNIKIVSNFSSRSREINSNSWTFKLITFVIIATIISFGGFGLWKQFIAQNNDDTATVNEISFTNLQTENSSVQTEIEPTVKPIAENKNEVVNQDSVLVSSNELDTEKLSSDDIVTKVKNNSTILTEQRVKPLTVQGVKPEEKLSADSSTPLSSSNESKQNLTPKNINITNTKEVVQPLKTEPVVSMRFQFFADCWVKIVDANGEAIAVGVKKGGKVMPLKGVAPISVILGEPSAVTLDFQGQAYDLTHFKAGRRATFVLE
ncbi:RodZ domain-containing protein [Aliikangiella sp. IMCC44359]|uniref:RodZ domain-containing protein n=1 Tax=Aliikangiella sp. IMCC44359 TaxID=3459125 RepID=UPI00403AEC96